MDEFELNRRRVAVAAIAKLSIAFGKEMPDEQIDIYIDFLSDIEPALLSAAVDKIIQTQSWFPPVADIRATALTTSNELTAGEAWAFVCRRIQTQGRSGGTQGFTELTKEAVAACGGYSELCRSENVRGDRFVFSKAYEAKSARQLESKVMSHGSSALPEMRQLVARIGKRIDE